MISKAIARSINKHFDAVKENYLLYFRADDSSIVDTKSNRIELRIDGPYIRYYHRLIRYDVEVNLLFTVHMTHESMYTINEMVDAMRLGMIDENYRRVDIPVRDDNDSLIGCLRLTPIVSGDREVQENHFGQIDTKTKLQQASLEGHYRMEISQ